MRAFMLRGGCRGSSCCEPAHGAGFRFGRHHHRPHPAEELGSGGGSFGVRRPLRFLAWKLGLGEAQVEQLAAVLNDLKTERAQAAVDDRRSLAAFADAIAGEAFGEDQAREAAALRTQSADRLQKAVVQALGRMHALLDPEQRGRLAYLIRTGTLTL
jgi:Spy/CpxP family protein refolding chaperone